MRTITLLAAVALAVSWGYPRHALAQPEPVAISAICGFEFAAAESVVPPEPSGAVATDGTTLVADASDVPAGAATEDEEPQPSTRAEDPDAATDVVAIEAVGTSLDGTIRACASVEEWVTAARLYPGVLRSFEAIDILVSRCSDPVAGLDGYATCRSLVEALATPAPTTAPVATPPASPPPTAEPDRAGSADGDDTADAGRSNGKKPKVTVSKRQIARIPGATGIRYFKIRGDSPAKLLRSNLRQGARHCGDHRAIACVLLSWSPSVTKAADPETGRCVIGKARTTLDATVFLPRWVDRGKASADLVRWWRKVVLQSAIHEHEHIRIQQRHLADFRREAKGKPCGSATIIFSKYVKRANRAQRRFDEAEYRKPLPPLPTSLLR